MSSTSTIHIIGAGLAGLAAALHASEAGQRVVLYESAPHAGGRCRSYHDKKLKTTIDNGNHLVMGANRGVLNYLAKIGTLHSCITADTPRYPFIDLATRHHWQYRPPRFQGIPWHEWRYMLRLFRPAKHKTVADCVPPSTALYRRLIEPFTLAALNTSPREASAALLASCLRALMSNGKDGWQTYVPAHSLSATFIDPALTRIKGRGGSIRYQTAITRLESKDGRITALHGQKEQVTVKAQDRVILSTPASVAKELLGDTLPALTYEGILNAHFQWPQAGMFRETMPFLGVINGTVQWIFFHEGRISTTTSAANAWMDKDEKTLAETLWHDVCRALYIDQPRVPPCRIIKEKRATFTATPENVQRRPEATTQFSNLFLAGDYLRSPYPATLEAAISSGFTAATLASESHPQGNND